MSLTSASVRGSLPETRCKTLPPAHGVARLTLHINGIAYAVRPIACDPAAALKAIRLRKADGTIYHIALTEHGPICDCPDFTFSREGIDPAGCKHILRLDRNWATGRERGGEMNSTPDRQEAAIDRQDDRLISAWTSIDTIVETDSRDHSIETVPVNGQPVNLAEAIDHEAMSYRSQGTPIGIFLAEQMARIAQLIRWTGATTPQEHLDRMEVWDAEIAESHFDRGYSEGYQASARTRSVSG